MPTAAQVAAGLKFTKILAADMLDGRTEAKEKGRLNVVEREGDDVAEGLGDGIEQGMKGLEDELACFPMFKSPAPLAKCEESSI